MEDKREGKKIEVIVWSFKVQKSYGEGRWRDTVMWKSSVWLLVVWLGGRSYGSWRVVVECHDGDGVVGCGRQEQKWWKLVSLGLWAAK